MKRSRILLLFLAMLLIGCQSAGVATKDTVPPPLTATTVPTQSIPAVAADVPRVPLQAFKDLLDAGQDIIVVDARDQDSYNTAHIPGARSIQDPDWAAYVQGLAPDTRIILYCA